MTSKRNGPPAAQQPPEGQKSGRHADYTNGNTAHREAVAMTMRRKDAALRLEPLPWSGQQRDPDTIQITTVRRCTRCYSGLAWTPGTRSAPPMCEDCGKRALGEIDQVTLDFVRERHDCETCHCGACMHLRAVA